MVTHPTEAKPSRTVHFQLPPGDDYVLKGFGGRYPLKSHTELTRRAFPELDTPEGRRATHYADAAVQPGDTIQLIRVYGANDGNGIPTLVSMAVSVAGEPSDRLYEHGSRRGLDFPASGRQRPDSGGGSYNTRSDYSGWILWRVDKHSGESE